jgi:hypothetical protein
MDKVVRIGSNRTHGGRWYSTYARIQFDGERLSIAGVEGPTQGGNAIGACGQIGGHVSDLAVERLAPKWNDRMLQGFRYVWKRWHLNDMRSGCQHQRDFGWVYEEHHDPKTFKGDACPICGYSIGSRWLTEQVPADIIEFLASLPDTDRAPAWV